MKRQPDGRWRSPGQSLVVSENILRARWVGAETLRLKQRGLSFEEIAELLTRIGRGQAVPLIALPEGVTFPTSYRISKQACHQAFRKALEREPSFELEELRKLDTARSEEMFLQLQPGISKGDLKAVAVGIKVLDHAAKIHGYAAPQRHELTGKDGKPLTLAQMLEAIGPISDEDKR